MQTVTLNGKQLREIAHKNRTAEVTTLSLAMRERLRHFSDISRTKNHLIRQGEKIVDSDYMQYWKDLEAAGVGSIIHGRRGNPNRFEWHYSLKKIAKAALEGTNEQVVREGSGAIPAGKPQVSRPQLKVVRRTPPAAASKAVSKAPEKTLFVPLRKDFDVEIKLPGDVSAEEIETLSKALRRFSA